MFLWPSQGAGLGTPSPQARYFPTQMALVTICMVTQDAESKVMAASIAGMVSAMVISIVMEVAR